MTLSHYYLDRFLRKDKKLKKVGRELADYKYIEVNSEDDVTALVLLHETENWKGWVKVGGAIDCKIVNGMARESDWNVNFKTNEDWNTKMMRKNLEAAAKILKKFVKKMRKRKTAADKLASMGTCIVKTIEDVIGLQELKNMTTWDGDISVHKTAPEAVLEMVKDANFHIQNNPEQKEKKVQTHQQK